MAAVPQIQWTWRLSVLMLAVLNTPVFQVVIAACHASFDTVWIYSLAPKYVLGRAVK
jgi:hypothetical protein